MKTKPALGRLGPLHIPKRELSYSLNMNLQGLATFSYKGTDAVSGQFEHCLAEKGERGFSFNVIEVGPELGHGQAGSVRLARHVVSGTNYALKEVNISEEGTRHQVVRELRIYKRCQQESFHPNIVALYDAFYAEGRVYMVLELMTWGSLDLALCNSRKKYLDNKKAQRSEGKRHEVKSSRAPSRQQANEEDSEQHGYAEACSTSSPLVDKHVSGCSDEGTSPRRSGGKRRGWAMEEPVFVEAAGCILHALNFLHRNYDIVHRDIKPGNVMLSRDGSVKISDFGVSMIHSADDCDRVALSGTAGYMSPEVLEGGICSGRGDIWALGIMMLECAKGLHPLIDDSWKVEGEEDDDEEENNDAKGAAGTGAVSVARTKSIQRVKSGQNWMHWTHFDVYSKVVKDAAPCAGGLGYSQDLENFIDLCLIKEEDMRPTAEKLLDLPLFAKHTACQQEKMREWLLMLGEPSGERANKDEIVFMHWNSNPLLPPPTPRDSERKEEKCDVQQTPAGTKRALTPSDDLTSAPLKCFGMPTMPKCVTQDKKDADAETRNTKARCI